MEHVALEVKEKNEHGERVEYVIQPYYWLDDMLDDIFYSFYVIQILICSTNPLDLKNEKIVLCYFKLKDRKIGHIFQFKNLKTRRMEHGK